MKTKFNLPVILTVFTWVYFISCEKEKTSFLHSNLSPVAKAGNDISIILPVNYVFLDGSASYDPKGNIKAYYWTQISGPSSYISNPNGAQTQVTSLQYGTYVFELTVTNEGYLTAKDRIQVSVNFNSCESRPLIHARLIPIGTISSARSGMFSASANNKIIFAGGYYEDGESLIVDIYDINSNSNTSIKAQLSRDWFGKRWGYTMASVENKILFAGGGEEWDGYGSTLVDIYDVYANTWTIAHISQGRSNLAAVTLNNKVYFAGGVYTEDKPPFKEVYSKVVDIYDNTTNTWTTTELSEGRYNISATTSDNKVIFAGGRLSDYSYKIDICDAAKNSWSTDKLEGQRSNMSTISTGNKIYWAGGYNASGLINNIEIKDLSTGTSSSVCIRPCSNPAAVIKNDHIIFFTGDSYEVVGTQFEIYNKTTDTWSTGILDQRLIGAAIISVNNTIYVAGGKLNNVGTNQVWKLEF